MCCSRGSNKSIAGCRRAERCAARGNTIPLVRRLTSCCLFALVLSTACSSGKSSSAAPTTNAAAASGASVTTTTKPTIAAEPWNKFTLNEGDCFNRYDAASEQVGRTTCDVAHDAEVFYKDTYPAPYGDPYPGKDELEKYTLRKCYERFEPYVGKIYELSELSIGVFVPTQLNFEDVKARYRGLTCWLRRSDKAPMSGSMRNRAL